MKRKICTFLSAAALLSCTILPASAAGTDARPCFPQCEPSCWSWSWTCVPCPDACLELPIFPETPAEPEAPVAPETPTEPETPAEPEKPVEPETPAEPEKPVEPETPTEPDAPVEPEKPAEPETPVVPDEDGYVIAALELEACKLVNEQRAANNLEPLTISAELCAKARVKSQDMLDNHYFDHNSPTYGSPFELMQRLGITYRTAGENIAMGYPTAEAVVNAWMNSAGHRANILSSNYTTMGIGYVNGYWTQWFIG